MNKLYKVVLDVEISIGELKKADYYSASWMEENFERQQRLFNILLNDENLMTEWLRFFFGVQLIIG